jgi:hypothetical protein
VGQTLTASYDGTETVTWQWQAWIETRPGQGRFLDLSGATGSTFTPSGAMTIRVVASAPGYNPKISAAVTVTAAGKTVTVGAAGGALTAGATGTVRFRVSQTGIGAGTFTATVALLPAGVTVQGGNVTFGGAAGTGTLTLAGNTSTVAGTYDNLTLTVEGATSPPFTLIIAPSGGSSTDIYATYGGTVTATNSALGIDENISGIDIELKNISAAPNGNALAVPAMTIDGIGFPGFEIQDVTVVEEAGVHKLNTTAKANATIPEIAVPGDIPLLGGQTFSNVPVEIELTDGQVAAGVLTLNIKATATIMLFGIVPMPVEIDMEYVGVRGITE